LHSRALVKQLLPVSEGQIVLMPLQLSARSHACPVLIRQTGPLARATDTHPPVAALHCPMAHTVSKLEQSRADPPHTPAPSHTSPTVQTCESLQGVPAGRMLELHRPSTQVLTTHGDDVAQSLSTAQLHSLIRPIQVPLTHTSLRVHATPSLQGVIAAAGTSSGQALLLPVHVSARSHCPAETRQIRLELANMHVESSQQAANTPANDASHCS
jgi:hypothetical protein